MVQISKEMIGTVRTSTTDDNAAAGKIFGGFVSVIYYWVYQAD